MEFGTYKEGMEYVTNREKEMGKMKFRSTQEYRDMYPRLMQMYKDEGHKKPTRHRVEISICLHV